MKHLYSFDQSSRKLVVDLRELSTFVIPRRKEFAPLLKYYINGSVDVDKLSKDIENITNGSNINESLSDVVKLGGLVLKALGVFATLPYWGYKDWMKIDGTFSTTLRSEKKEYLILITLVSIMYILTYSYLGMIIYKNHIDPDTGIVKEKKLVEDITVEYTYYVKGSRVRGRITIPEHYILKVNIDGKDQTWHTFDMERSDTIKVGSKLTADGDITQVGPWYEWTIGTNAVRISHYPKEK